MFTVGIFEMCSFSRMLLKIALANGKIISCGSSMLTCSNLRNNMGLDVGMDLHFFVAQTSAKPETLRLLQTLLVGFTKSPKFR